MSKIKVMSTLAVELALKKTLLPAWVADGNDIEMVWNPTGVLIDQVRSGERGDVLIAIDQSIENLVRDGIIRQETVRPVARASFGLGARQGAILPDISTPDRFKQVLLSSRAIAYSLTGASGLHFKTVLADMGVAAAVNARAVTIPAGFTADKVLSGEAEFAVQQVSELMSVEGIQVVGPFPEPYQKTTDFSAAVFTDAKNPEQAAAFIRHLSGTKAANVYASSGLEARAPMVA